MQKPIKILIIAFGCNKTGDLIQFVQDYFNIEFREALNKINIDFNLNIQNTFKMDFGKLERIKKQQEYMKHKKEEFKKRKNKELQELCNYSNKLTREWFELNQNIKPYNWEENVSRLAIIQEELEKNDLKFEELINKKLES